MVETENSRKWPIFALIIGVIFILVLVFVSWRFGSEGFFTALKWLLIIGFVISIVILIVLAVFWLFKRHKKQMVFIMKKAIVDTCMINKNSYKQELWLFGGNVPMPSPKKLGVIVGFSMIKSAVKKMYDPNLKIIKELEKPKDVIFCAFNTGGLMDKILGNYSIFAGVYPDDFMFNGKLGDLTGSEVYINDGGFGLSPQIFKMFWLQKHWKEGHLIEETSKEMIHRLLIEDNLNELGEVIYSAVAVQPREESDKSVAEQTGLDKKIGVNLSQ